MSHFTADPAPRLSLGSAPPLRRSVFAAKDYLLLTAAIVSLAYSILLWFGILGAPNKDAGMFVAVWVPSILALGCFSKLARIEARHG